MKKSLLSLFLLLFLCPLYCQTFTGCLEVDFEDIPNETPVEGLVISDQYFASHGVSFSLENGQAPILAQVGGAATAFGSAFGNDAPVPGSGIGEFFLTDDGNLSGLSMIPVIITFANPIDSFSTCVLDIDFDEYFILEARDENGMKVLSDTIYSGDPGTGDGVSTCWGFNFDGCEGTIYSVRFEGFRDVAGAFGLGMDNFSFCFSGVDLANELSVTPTDQSCDSETGLITITNLGDEPQLYSLDGINYQSSPVFADLPVGTYTLFVQDTAGCTAILEDIEVEAFVPLQIDEVEVVDTQCAADNGTISIATTPSAGVTYSIDGVSFQSSNTFENLSAGGYPIFILDADGCPYTSSASIAPSTAPNIDAFAATVDACNDGSAQLQASASGGTGPLTFNLNGGPAQELGSFNNLFAGEYLLAVTDELGCEANELVNVEGGPVFLIDEVITSPPTCGPPDGAMTIQASGGTGMLYYQVEGSIWSSSPVFTELTAGTFEVVVLDAVGCRTSTEVSLPPPVCQVFIPNVFSPNDDGENDQFELFTNSLYDVNVLEYKIFDRWGELVWRRENFTIHTSDDWWDGYFRGQPATQGVYVYLVHLQYNNGVEEVRAGDVCLIR